MPIMNAALGMLIVLAVAIAGVLTVLDEILGGSLPTEHERGAERDSKNTERGSGGESRA
jgi:hypothetical protein